MRTISVRLDSKTDSNLRAYCQRTGMSQTDAVKAGIEALVGKAKPNPYALAEQMGLVGAFDSGRGDLGENHSRYVKEKLARRHRDRG